MKYKPIISSYWLKSDEEFDIPIEIFVDTFSYTIIPDDTIRIIIIQEPFRYDLINIVLNKNNDKYYTYVFTYNQEVLDKNKKAVHFLCVNTWIKNYDFPIKNFSVSTLIGGKVRQSMEGYDYRHMLWSRRNEISIPKKIYLSSQFPYVGADYHNNLVLGSNLIEKHVMFNNEFHIAIENTSMLNMFTEKLIDCFQTKTIPIYYGCSNIGDFFNVDGMYLVSSVDDIINICNNLTTETYKSKLYAIEDNYLRSMSYLSHTQILDKKLNEVLKINN